MKRFTSALLAVMATILVSSQAQAFRRPHWRSRPIQKPLVQMAILLDTSNSMDGLIEQAKSQLWKIVNDLQYATQGGERPLVQVALFEYGNDGLSAGEHYVRQVMPFTTDLDVISEKLFALRTNGGSEYTGAVIKDAVHGLAWDDRESVYKVIFIAGNEPFTQGPVPYRESITAAVRKGIVVNPIFCGPANEGVQTQWYDGAVVGRGQYLNIDPNTEVVAIPTPYDDEISRLGQDINHTYVAYGMKGKEAKSRQLSMDRAAQSYALGGAVTERSLAKAAPQAAAPAWDAATAVTSGRIRVSSLKKEDLPAELQGKSNEELEKTLLEQQATRTRIQTRLTELQGRRRAFLANKETAQSRSGAMSLDQAMRQAIRTQAATKHFQFGR